MKAIRVIVAAVVICALAGAQTLNFPALSTNNVWTGTNAFGQISAAQLSAATLLVSSTAPTISSGFGTSPSLTNPNGTAAFTVTVGTGGTATNGVIGLPTAAHGWNCRVDDLTTQSATVFYSHQIASTTASATIANFNTSGAQAAWAANDVLSVSCFGR